MFEDSLSRAEAVGYGDRTWFPLPAPTDTFWNQAQHGRELGHCRLHQLLEKSRSRLLTGLKRRLAVPPCRSVNGILRRKMRHPTNGTAPCSTTPQGLPSADYKNVAKSLFPRSIQEQGQGPSWFPSTLPENIAPGCRSRPPAPPQAHTLILFLPQ